ncbi:MFS transporter [Tsukamurella sp. PLM1]|uniref:MFS transporter n=1 Tax=Tsukamurella sp. PLM1 TaxID=2929795 RepID=UPI00204D846C|nr:MFS transporter [Tsukamurella sp. PLM1]BDH57819.1 putative transmembrane-transport protein [Tsukamurella sp. PLM1]
MSTTPRRAWAGLAALLLPVFLVSMDASVLFLAMPHLTTALNPTSAQQLWILDIYPFMLAGLLITMGNLGDRWGRRRLMTWGAGLFGVASVIAAFSPTPGLLIAARALMGVGGATLLPASLALIANMFRDARARGVAVGVWTAAFSFGMAVGPVIGGVLLHHYWWGSVFLINAPVFLAFLVAGPLLIPEFRTGSSAPFDLVGVALSMAAIFPIVYAVKSAAGHGVHLSTVLIAAAGVAMLIAFIMQQRRTPHPLIPFDLFRNRVFAMAIVGTVIAISTLSSMSYLTGIYLQSVVGFDVLAAAFLGLPAAASVAYFSMRAPWIEQYLGRRTTFVAALLFAALGQVLLVGLGTNGPAWLYVLGTVVAGFGYGTLFTFVSAVALASAPPERAGQASSMSEMSFELGTATGLAVLGSVATAVFTRHDGMSRTLGDTLARAGESGGPDGAALADAARSAWVDALTTTVGVSSLLLVLTAAAAFVVLRERTPVAPEPVAC